MKRRVLEGPWRLSYRSMGTGATQAGSTRTPIGDEEARLVPVEATVPGNVELDLSRAGILPADLFHGENILAVRELENHEWWYATAFSLTAEELEKDLELVFHGVDGDAEYLMNDQLIGTSSNSLIAHVFALAGVGLVGDNELVVHLRPSRPPVAIDELVPLWSLGEPLREESVWVRKAAHVYGWDIMPRALSAGIWRPVELVEHDAVEISKLYLTTISASEEKALLRVYYEIRGEWEAQARHQLVVTGSCGSSSFRLVQDLVTCTGALNGVVASPRLWWPRDYGAPDMYEVTTQLLKDGVIMAARTDRHGIRTVELARRGSAPGRLGDFRIIVNGTPVYCRGTNWVPVDVFHSRDAEGLEGRLELLWRSNSNMVRCWGGNVYENDAFFDYCDAHGLMVWQDFSLACAIYPQAEMFQRVLKDEVRGVARRLRSHPSIVLWCGDNEGDQTSIRNGIAPAFNLVTRRVIPDVLHQEDPHRPYLPSSPFIDHESEEVMRSRDLRGLPEAHLWGPRDYFKSDFYRGASAAFVSEIGFMGLPAPESLSRFLDEEALWPYQNRQWLVHGTDPTLDFSSRYWLRTVTAFECVRYFFGQVPASLQDAVVASQIVQAEGFKYAIESGRQRKWSRTGVLWWNLVDGWPQISDAVVDYYLTEKLAFEYIVRAQRPLALVAGEPVEGRHAIVACNDTRRDVSGSFQVLHWGSGEPVLEGVYSSPANETVEIGAIELPDQQSLLTLEWTDPDGVAGNHYLVGHPPFDLIQYRKWLEIIGIPDRR